MPNLRRLVLISCFAIGVRGQTVTTTVSAGSGPRSAALNPVTNRIYVPNAGSNNVTMIDGATNSTTTVTVGTAPGGLP